MPLKTLIAIAAVILAFVGYAPYIRDIFKGKTTPHVFTWLIWSLAVGISAGLQLYGGAGAGAWTTVAVTLICVFILILSLTKGNKHITKSDIVFLILALVSLFLWLVIHQPVWSAILVVLTDLLGFIPTIRKTWNNPYSETLSTYEITAVRHGLSIAALAQFNILTLLYPVAWTLANVLFSLMLILRRRANEHSQNTPPTTL
jgi:hypothetical protein